jgi:hypothetical protein
MVQPVSIGTGITRGYANLLRFGLECERAGYSESRQLMAMGRMSFRPVKISETVLKDSFVITYYCYRPCGADIFVMDRDWVTRFNRKQPANQRVSVSFVNHSDMGDPTGPGCRPTTTLDAGGYGLLH